MVGASRAAARRSSSSGTRRTGFRSDIQGLRAIAVLLVVLYHAGVPVLGGGYVGVDVFFVISGFLITGLIVREVEKTGRLSLRDFYARRARRLLPAAALATLAIAAITVSVLPVTRWRDVAGDLLASTVYLVNWRLADRAVDYLGAESATSPAQHFWSLAVEEQFYVVWPLLIVALVVGHRRWSGGSPTGVRAVLLAGLIAVTVPSLLWSVWLTAEDPGRAYFVTTTRLWELGIGALLVFGAGWFARWSSATRAVAGWAGVAAILVAAGTYDAETAFPGSAALLPTLGAAAVLAAGVPRGASDQSDGQSALLGRALGAPVMRALGAWSYSLYLWHWPVIVAAAALWGVDGAIPVWVGMVAAAFSVLPAWLSYRFVEKPVHEGRAFALPWRAALVGATCVALGVGSSAAVSAALERETSATSVAGGAEPGADGVGAAAFGDEPVDHADEVLALEPETITPHPAEAVDDLPQVNGKTCISTTRMTTVSRCTVGAEDADTVVALAGDSKIHQWLPAVEEIAQRRGWRVETYLASACPMTRAPVQDNSGNLNEKCAEINEQRIDAIAENPDIDVVLTTQGSREAYSADASEKATAVDRMREGLREAWEPLLSAGKRIVVMRDNPRPTLPVMDCVAANTDDLDKCTFQPEDEGSTVVDAAEEVGLPVVDMTPWICPTDTCPPVVGGVLVYRTGTHLTATYAETAAPYLEEQLVDVGLP